MLWKIIVAAVAAVILLIILIVTLRKRKARIRAIHTKAEDKRREEELNRLILNPNAAVADQRQQAEKPYAVRYGVEEENKAKVKPKRRMLQIEEHSELSVRSYMLDPAYPITIGSGKDNTVVLPGGRHEASVCVIEMLGEKICLSRSSLSEEITVVRGKNRTGIERKKLEMHSGDLIMIGDDYLKLTIVDRNE